MESDEYYIPLEDQRIFGAGVKRKRIAFVPAQFPVAVPSHNPLDGTTAADKYLDIVLRNRKTEANDRSCGAIAQAELSSDADSKFAQYKLPCDVCNLPRSPADTSVRESKRPHEAYVSHQVCLAHSHPPSHLNRDRHGLRYLSSYGWDPDSRLGLGAAGEGIREPVKAKNKSDTAGLGVKMRGKVVENKVEKLDAGRIRRRAGEQRKRVDGLKEIFWGNDEVVKYLGGG